MVVDVTVLDVSLIPRQQDTQDVGVERDPPVAWMIDVSFHFPIGINRRKNVNKCRKVHGFISSHWWIFPNAGEGHYVCHLQENEMK